MGGVCLAVDALYVVYMTKSEVEHNLYILMLQKEHISPGTVSIPFHSSFCFLNWAMQIYLTVSRTFCFYWTHYLCSDTAIIETL